MTRFDHANVPDLGVRYCYNLSADVVLITLGEELKTMQPSKGNVRRFLLRVRGDVLV